MSSKLLVKIMSGAKVRANLSEIYVWIFTINKILEENIVNVSLYLGFRYFMKYFIGNMVIKYKLWLDMNW